MSTPLPPIEDRDWRTPEELVWILPAPSLRWVKDRLQPSHPGRLPHVKIGDLRVFFPEQIAEIRARHLVPGVQHEDHAPAVRESEVVSVDPALFKAGVAKLRRSGALRAADAA